MTGTLGSFSEDQPYLGLGQRVLGYFTPRVLKRWLQLVHVHHRFVTVTLLPSCPCLSQQQPLKNSSSATQMTPCWSIGFGPSLLLPTRCSGRLWHILLPSI